jgi:hypothetical protein
VARFAHLAQHYLVGVAAAQAAHDRVVGFANARFQSVGAVNVFVECEIELVSELRDELVVYDGWVAVLSGAEG